MGYEKRIGLAAIGAMVLMAFPAIAAPREPLVVTSLPDPDPNFVPPPREHNLRKRNAAVVDDYPRLDAAMEEFGQALGQAAMAQQQALEERCRANESASQAADSEPLSDEKRMAWEAACKYLRR